MQLDGGPLREYGYAQEAYTHQIGAKQPHWIDFKSGISKTLNWMRPNLKLAQKHALECKPDYQDHPMKLYAVWF